jgi:hypothetical protein
MSYELLYWPIKAKNIAPALALTFTGSDWKSGAGPGSKGTGDLWAEWLDIKPTTTWGYLPNLVVPGGKTIGNELAILQFIARKNPAFGGESDADFHTSQELLHQSEELYQKLAKWVPTIMAADKSPEDFKAFWRGNDARMHSSSYGLLVYLAQFETFMATCGVGNDRYTAFGTTIGEIKLFATLYLVTLIDPQLQLPGNVAAFVSRFNEEKAVVATLDKLKDTAQYFIAPPSAA